MPAPNKSASTSKETDSLEVWYDQKQMQKVINNLLSNAVKHTKAEDSITLNIKTEGSNAVIRVTDTGSGIDARKWTRYSTASTR